ncbi:MAG: hypothetical protein ACE5GT_06345 [Rhodospirillales bacterium]
MWLTGLIGLVAMLSGVPGMPGLAFFHSAPHPPAQLPTYRVGDTFTYLNDRKEKVIRRVTRVEGDYVVWETETNYRFTSFRNFSLPRVNWDGKKSSGTMITFPAPDLLWPLKAGNKAEFTVRYKRFIKKTKKTVEYDQIWRCKVNKVRAVATQMGTFDSFKIICDERKPRRDGKTRVARTRIWYYAPEIGHYVKRVLKYRKKRKKTMELVSVQKAARQ